MSSPIECVVRQALDTFSRLSAPSEHRLTNGNSVTSAFDANLSRLRQMVDCLTAADVQFDTALVKDKRHVKTLRAARPVTYVRLLDCDIVSVGIFVLHNGYRMPIHDHPHMYGLLKVLYGRVHVQSYTRLLDADGVWQSRETELGRVWRTRAEPAQQLSPDDPATLLTPDHANIHQVSAEHGPAAFLDILAPPYDDASRVYHNYRNVSSDQLRRLTLGELAESGWLLSVDDVSLVSDMAPYRGPSLQPVLAQFRAQTD